MMLTLYRKPTFEQFIETCTPLAVIEPLEVEIRQRIDSIAAALLTFQPTDDPLENLTRFLQADKNFLGIVLALTNLSQEKFLRILTAERFANDDYGQEWNIDRVGSKLRSDPIFAERIARLYS